MANGRVIDMKSSKVGTAKGGSRTVVTLKESITYQNCEKLQTEVDGYINQGKNEVVLDCKAVSFIDSEGLAFLVRINDKLRNRGGLLKIVSPNAVCRDIFLATRLINTLSVFVDIHEAIRGKS